MHTINIPHDQFISPIAYTTRAQMMDALRAHGWMVEQGHNGHSVVISIRGPWHGVCWVEVPDRQADDHGSALQDVYKVIGHAMSDVMGISGRA